MAYLELYVLSSSVAWLGIVFGRMGGWARVEMYTNHESRSRSWMELDGASKAHHPHPAPNAGPQNRLQTS